MATSLDILIEARSFIEAPEQWTKGADARGDYDLPVPPRCDTSAAWSVEGALEMWERLLPSCVDEARWILVGVVYRSVPHPHDWEPRDLLRWWNDRPERTHSDVMQAWDLAIRRAQTLGLEDAARIGLDCPD